MKTKEKSSIIQEPTVLDEGEAIEKGFEQMEMIYRSRCIQPPQGSNVTVRDIEVEKTTKEK